MYPSISKYLYFAAQAVNGEPVYSKLRELENTQWYSLERLRELQWTRLKNLLHYAFENVPYYTKRFDFNGISPDDINSFEDMNNIPYLTKDDIWRHKASLISSNAPDNYMVARTSGTVGEPTVILKSKTSWAYHHAKLFRTYRWYGIDVGDRWAKIMGRRVNPYKKVVDLTKNVILNRIGIPSVEMTEDICEKFYKRILKFSPIYLYGYPSAISHFVRFLKDKGIDGKVFQIKMVVCSGETLNEYISKEIENYFNCKVVNDYACAEVGTISIDCPEGNMHISDESIYLEILLNQDYGEGHGEVVITDLHSYVMPLIRYRLGDIASLRYDRCTCGRQLSLMTIPIGRVTSMITTPEGKRVHSSAINYIFSSDIMIKDGTIKNYQVVHKSPSKFNVCVVGFLDSKQQKFLLSEFMRYFGDSAKIEINLVDQIDTTSNGKLSNYIKGF